MKDEIADDWPPEETFADRLSRLRRAVDVENTVIAEAAGVSAKTVSHWIGGQQPEAEALLRLAAFFGVTPHWLLTGEGASTVLPASRKHSVDHPPNKGRRPA